MKFKYLFAYSFVFIDLEYISKIIFFMVAEIGENVKLETWGITR